MVAELISKTALLAHFRKEREDYFNAHFKQDPATGTWEAGTPEEEYLSDLEERIDFIEQFPAVMPVGKLINNNQPGWTNIIETEPNVTIDVGTPVYVAPERPRELVSIEYDEKGNERARHYRTSGC